MIQLDLVIRNGTVVDGSGAAPRRADVAIASDRIVAVGEVDGHGRREIDATGHVVSPGFIDAHTHYDAQLNWDPLGTNSCWHGVTTVVMGNCGFSIAPMRTGQQALMTRILERAEDISAAAMNAGIDWRWESFADYLDVVDTLPKGINFAAYVGHSALRTWAMGERAFDAQASADELARMTGELRRALAAGAIGLSTSRSPAHETADDRPVASRVADWVEVQALARTLSDYPGTLFEIAHERPKDPAAEVEYHRKLIELGRETGVTMTFGVLGVEQLALIERAAAQGARMVGQTHSRGVTTLLSFMTNLPFDHLPDWRDFRRGSIADQIAGLKDPNRRRGLVDAVQKAVYDRAVGAEARAPDWDKLYVYSTPLPPYVTVGELARERNRHPVEVLIDEALAHDLDLFFIQPLSSVDPAVLLPVMKHPSTVMTFSDSGAHVGQIADASIHTHFLAYWHRARQAFTLPEAIHIITGRAAAVWGFTERGLVRPGYIADLNVFDPLTIAPAMPRVAHDFPAGARRLSQKAIGIKATIVGGRIVIEDGVHAGPLPGRLIRRSEKHEAPLPLVARGGEDQMAREGQAGAR